MIFWTQETQEWFWSWSMYCEVWAPGCSELTQACLRETEWGPGHTRSWACSALIAVLIGILFCSSMENGRPPDPADWAVMDVVNYFRMAGFEEQASAFQEQVTQSREIHNEHDCLPSPQQAEGTEKERHREQWGISDAPGHPSPRETERVEKGSMEVTS